MMELGIAQTLATILVTSVVQGGLTIVMLKTSLKYIEKDLMRIDAGVTRAHERIDAIA